MGAMWLAVNFFMNRFGKLPGIHCWTIVPVDGPLLGVSCASEQHFARAAESGAPPIPDAFLAPTFEASTVGASEAQSPAWGDIATISAGVPYSKQDLGGAR
jgi:hypothetical protein